MPQGVQNTRSMEAPERHLRVVPDTTALPEWRRYRLVFEDILEGRRGDRRISWTAPAREALLSLACDRWRIERRRVDQMLDWSPAPDPEEPQRKSADAPAGPLSLPDPQLMEADPVYRTLMRAPSLCLHATLKENLDALAGALRLWPELVVRRGAASAVETVGHEEGREISVDELPAAFHAFPRRIKRLQLEAIRHESRVREFESLHKEKIASAVRRRVLFTEQRRGAAVLEFEMLLTQKYGLLEQRRALLHELTLAYGWRLRTLRESDTSLLPCAAPGLGLGLVDDAG